MKSYRLIILLLLFLLFLYIPIFPILYDTFWINGSFTFNSFYIFFNTSDLLKGLVSSFYISFISMIISLSLLLSILKYLFLYKNSKIIFYLTIPALIIPEVVLAVSLLMFFITLNIPLGKLTLIASYVTFSLGYTVPLLYQKWLQFNQTYIIAAEDLGASNDMIWKTIIIPLFKPIFISAGFLSFILAFDDYLFAYFCSAPDTLTLSMPLLQMLRNGMSQEIKVLSTIIMVFSFLIGSAYIVYEILKKKV